MHSTVNDVHCMSCNVCHTMNSIRCMSYNTWCHTIHDVQFTSYNLPRTRNTSPWSYINSQSNKLIVYCFILTSSTYTTHQYTSHIHTYSYKHTLSHTHTRMHLLFTTLVYPRRHCQQCHNVKCRISTMS